MTHAFIRPDPGHVKGMIAVLSILLRTPSPCYVGTRNLSLSLLLMIKNVLAEESDKNNLIDYIEDG